MLSQTARGNQTRRLIPARASLYPSVVMSEHGKCPMGKHPWLAAFFVVAFALVFLAHKLGLL